MRAKNKRRFVWTLIGLFIVVFAIFIYIKYYNSFSGYNQKYTYYGGIPAFLPLGKEVFVDLNGDGKTEKIYYGKDDFRINDKSYSDVERIKYGVFMNNPSTDSFILTDINTSDNQYEIGLISEGPSADPTVSFFSFNGGKLIEIGDIPIPQHYLETCFDTNGFVNGELRLSVLQTWYAPVQWELTSKNRFLLVTPDIYYPSQDYGTSDKLPVMLKIELPIYKNIDDTVSSGTIKPQEVIFTATDNKSRCYIEGKDGTKGWFLIDGYSNITDLKIEAQDVFDNLFIAD